MKRNITAKKTLAKELYVNANKSQKEISDLTGVTEKTLKKWREEGEWDILKAANSITPEELARELMLQINSIQKAAKEADRPLTPNETDSISKLSKAVSNIKQKPNLGVVASIMEEFVMYVKNISLPEAQRIVPYQMSYLEKKAKE